MNKFLLLLFTLFLTSVIYSQKDPPRNWQLMDFEKDSIRGLSVEKAYEKLLKKKKSKKVIVAVIDDGFNENHPALKGLLWTNAKEIPNNGKDDDKNGYVDDRHGWNFIGESQNETAEVIREYIVLRRKFEPTADTLDPQYSYWRRVKTESENKLFGYKRYINRFESVVKSLDILQQFWSKQLAKDSVYYREISHLKLPKETDTTIVKQQRETIDFLKRGDTIWLNKLTLNALANNFTKTILEPNRGYLSTATAMIDNNDIGYFRKVSPGDSPENNDFTFYGNANITAKTVHGTACAGIIAAWRKGDQTFGITNQIQIMPIKILVPNVIGDERDKDVANAIRYAVDNGAKIINMSFGKSYSGQQQLVDEAVRYAANKGVLLVTAAGNEATNIDHKEDFPTANFIDGTKATNLLKIGASTYDGRIIWPYSNYGKNTVDFFAPGDAIYVPGLEASYYINSGSSFAAPMVSGIAALIWSYYPKLTLQQVRECLESSAKPMTDLVLRPRTDEQVPFESLSKTGGIVNAYEALLIAEKLSK